MAILLIIITIIIIIMGILFIITEHVFGLVTRHLHDQMQHASADAAAAGEPSRRRESNGGDHCYM